MEAPRASGSGLPRDLIQVRGRGFAGYTKTTGRTGRVIPVAVVMVVMPRVAAHACVRPVGRTRLALAFIFDMAPRGHDRMGGCQVLQRHMRGFFTLRKKQLAVSAGSR